MPNSLSKSTFVTGLQCHKRLWKTINDRDSQPALTKTQQHHIDQGNEVGRYAQTKFPEGQLIAGTVAEALTETQQAIAQGATCLFEATVAYKDLVVRCDILQRQDDNSWHLIEVKSSTKVKDEHLWDVAIQVYVLSSAGFQIDRISLMYVNSQDCVYPDLHNLLVTEEITEQVLPLLTAISQHHEQFRLVLAESQAPDILIGEHCHKPNPCPFMADCWQHVPEVSIFTIPRLAWPKKTALIAQNQLAIADLPNEIKLTEKQQAYVNLIRHNQPEINREAIAQNLSQLTYPLHFFDFETLNPVLPRFRGMKPYEQFPFQYSCHILATDGELQHHEFLHTETTDPRLHLVKSLVEHIGSDGSVIVYNQSFEARILKSLAYLFPDYRDALLSIVDRLWDQHTIFKSGHYAHPAFLGRTSIKTVLPVLAPHLNYKDLEVQQGNDAQVVWEQMIQCENPTYKQSLAKSLKEYCKLDTWAMVEIHHVLRAIAPYRPLSF